MHMKIGRFILEIGEDVDKEDCFVVLIGGFNAGVNWNPRFSGSQLISFLYKLKKNEAEFFSKTPLEVLRITLTDF